VEGRKWASVGRK
jgi:hypothetical protein